MSRKPSLPLLSCALLALPLALACGEKPKLTGKVTDVWGKPVDGATVIVEGITGHLSTDADGSFSVEAPTSATRIQAGRDGYIQNVVEWAPAAEGEDAAGTVEIALYPEPDHTGFYGVAQRAYLELPAQTIATKGTELKAYTGVTDVGDERFAAQEPMRFVFTSAQRRERIRQLDLRLHKLDFIDEIELPGVLGDDNAEVELWVADGPARSFTLTGLPSEDDFLIEITEELPSGVYAFHTQGALTSSSYEALDKLPKEHRRAWTFEVP